MLCHGNVRRSMPAPLHIYLRYRGPSVDYGTMAIEDVIETLHGFASAYERVASQVDPEDSHQLRITGLRNESFGLLIAAITQASGGNPQNAVDLAVHVGKYVVSTLFAVIKLKQ